ncbi:ABC transporter permease subunit [Eubacteriales bacterium OttesenSCG-928-M02]|nr:ABC transporter permease subunit [Eubacteriales bacterium OttesenSCG-928-M02]
MFNATLFFHELRANYRLLLLFLIVLSLYMGVIITMFDPALGSALDALSESMPGLFAAFGMMNPGATLLQFLANYLYGFLLIAFPLVFLIMLSNKLVARYVDHGSMAYLLATPHTRRSIILTQMLVLLSSTLLLVLFVTLFGILLSHLAFPGALDVGTFLLLNLGWLCLLLFLGGLCFFFSCLFNDSRRSYGFGIGLTIAFLLVQMLSQVGDKLEGLRYATPLSLFQPTAILAGDAAQIWMLGLLFLLGAALFTAGAIIFTKKDMPL